MSTVKDSGCGIVEFKTHSSEPLGGRSVAVRVDAIDAIEQSIVALEPPGVYVFTSTTAWLIDGTYEEMMALVFSHQKTA